MSRLGTHTGSKKIPRYYITAVRLPLHETQSEPWTRASDEVRRAPLGRLLTHLVAPTVVDGLCLLGSDAIPSGSRIRCVEMNAAQLSSDSRCAASFDARK